MASWLPKRAALCSTKGSQIRRAVTGFFPENIKGQQIISLRPDKTSQSLLSDPPSCSTLDLGYTSWLFLTARTLPHHPKKISRIKYLDKEWIPCFFINFALGNRAGVSAHLEQVLLVCGLAYHSLLICLYCGTTVTLTDISVLLREGIFICLSCGTNVIPFIDTTVLWSGGIIGLLVGERTDGEHKYL